MFSDESFGISQPRKTINGDAATYVTNASDIAHWSMPYYDVIKNKSVTSAICKGIRNNTAYDCTVVLHLKDDYNSAGDKVYTTWIIPAGQTVGAIFDHVVKTGTSSPSGCLFFPL